MGHPIPRPWFQECSLMKRILLSAGKLFMSQDHVRLQYLSSPDIVILVKANYAYRKKPRKKNKCLPGITSILGKDPKQP